MHFHAADVFGAFRFPNPAIPPAVFNITAVPMSYTESDTNYALQST